MMDVTRRCLPAALVLCLLLPAGKAWGQAYAPSQIVNGAYPAAAVPAYWPAAQPGAFVPVAAAPAYYPNAGVPNAGMPNGGMYVPYFIDPNAPQGVIPTAAVWVGEPGQKPAGAPPQEGAPEGTGPAAEVEAPDVALDFSLQSATFASASYAAAPSMIGDMFGGGSSTATISNVMPFAVTARGTYFGGTPGALMASIGFDVDAANGSTDFFSVGDALDADGRMFAIDEPVPPTDAPRPAGGGFAFSGGTATNSPIVNPTIGNGQLWDVLYSFTETTTIAIPNPGGSVVGRMKLAENASPMPRNRVFVNYSFFDNVPLQATGVAVNRFTPGFEKAARDTENASVEVRFPFAATLSPNILSNGATETGDIQFGNIFITFKKVFEQTDNYVISAGTSITIPTASDLSVSMPDGTQLVHIENRSVRVLPFLAGLTTVGDRMFAQGFMQFDFDTAGNPVNVNLSGSGLASAGTVQATNFVYLDIGMGYWLRRPEDNPDAFITAIVPTLELHMNRSLQATDVIAAGPFRIGDPQRAIQLDSFVVGGTVETAGRDTFTVGYAIPFGNHADQAFDGELRAFWNRPF